MTVPDRNIAPSKLVRVPQHVVFKTFVNETVILNLQTGVYHGLNLTAGRMLEELERTGDFDVAVGNLAEALQQPLDVVRRDLEVFCRSLDERGLVELEGWS